MSPLKKTDPLSLTKTDPIAVGGFSAEFGIGKCLRAQTFMRANTVASGEKEKARDVGFAQEAKNLETAGACAPRVTATREMADNGPSHAQLARCARLLFQSWFPVPQRSLFFTGQISLARAGQF
jgi:hypothetical protein